MYMVSRKWLKEYKEYIFYEDIQKNNKPQEDQDGNKRKHPGKITNEVDLLESVYKEDLNMRGTGKLEQFEKTSVDNYLRRDLSEKVDFKLVS